MKIYLLPRLMIATCFLLLSMQVFAVSEKYKPYFLADMGGSSVNAIIDDIKTRLREAGFKVVGEYRPYPKATVISFTNNTLKRIARKEPNALYMTALRISVTDISPTIQVSYSNPTYFAYAYRVKASVESVTEKLIQIFGKQEDFGSKRGLKKRKLKHYHYSFGMEYFDEPLELNKFDNQRKAIDTIETGFLESRGDTRKIYRIDIPGKNMTVYGVSITAGEGSDKNLSANINCYTYKHNAHFPYEISVINGVVQALHPRFRIALAFPDTRMAGRCSFMSIMNAPVSINSSLTQLAGGVINNNDDGFGGDADY